MNIEKVWGAYLWFSDNSFLEFVVFFVFAYIASECAIVSGEASVSF